MEEKLVYDPKSTLILDLVEEYINHYLYEEAETLLKDYLKDAPLSKRAIELWMKIAEGKGEVEKYKKLKEKFEKLEKIYLEEKIKIKEKEFLKERKEVEEIREIQEFPLKEMEELFESFLKGLKLGKAKKIIIEDKNIFLYIKKNGKWTEIKFKESTKFPEATWIMKSLEKIK
ncbi:MAG: hypothetical protein ABIM36_02940 [candidate division WOR-3 bacterium]